VQYPELKHHTIVLGPRYRGLLDDIFRAACWRTTSRCTCTRPRAPIPSLAPPGHEAFYVLSPVPNNRSGIDWSREAEPYFGAHPGASWSGGCCRGARAW
jgi:phytoene desaturase